MVTVSNDGVVVALSFPLISPRATAAARYVAIATFVTRWNIPTLIIGDLTLLQRRGNRRCHSAATRVPFGTVNTFYMTYRLQRAKQRKRRVESGRQRVAGIRYDALLRAGACLCPDIRSVWQTCLPPPCYIAPPDVLRPTISPAPTGSRTGVELFPRCWRRLERVVAYAISPYTPRAAHPL